MALSINDLSPDLLGKIFAHCDKEELHKCRLVCKQWQATVDTIHPHTPQINNKNSQNLTAVVNRKKIVVGIVVYSLFLVALLTFATIKIWRDERFTTRSKYVRISCLWFTPLLILLVAVGVFRAGQAAGRQQGKELLIAMRNYNKYLKQENQESLDLFEAHKSCYKNIKYAQELTKDILKKMKENIDVDKRKPGLATISDTYLKNITTLLEALDAIEGAMDKYPMLPNKKELTSAEVEDTHKRREIHHSSIKQALAYVSEQCQGILNESSHAHKTSASLL